MAILIPSACPVEKKVLNENPRGHFWYFVRPVESPRPDSYAMRCMFFPLSPGYSTVKPRNKWTLPDLLIVSVRRMIHTVFRNKSYCWSSTESSRKQSCLHRRRRRQRMARILWLLSCPRAPAAPQGSLKTQDLISF